MSNSDCSDDECINREFLVHDSMLSKYNLEWERTRDIESKATNLIGFVGVIFAIEAIAFSGLDNISCIEIILLGLSLLSLFITILFCLYVLNIKSWECGVKYKTFMEDYAANANINRFEMLKTLSLHYADSGLKNSKTNDKNSKYLRYAFYSFEFSITTTVIYLAYMLKLAW